MRAIRLRARVLIMSAVAIIGVSMSAQEVATPPPTTLHQRLSAKAVRFDRASTSPGDQSARASIRAATADAERHSSNRDSRRRSQHGWKGSAIVFVSLLVVLAWSHSPG